MSLSVSKHFFTSRFPGPPRCSTAPGGRGPPAPARRRRARTARRRRRRRPARGGLPTAWLAARGVVDVPRRAQSRRDGRPVGPGGDLGAASRTCARAPASLRYPTAPKIARGAGGGPANGATAIVHGPDSKKKLEHGSKGGQDTLVAGLPSARSRRSSGRGRPGGLAAPLTQLTRRKLRQKRSGCGPLLSLMPRPRHAQPWAWLGEFSGVARGRGNRTPEAPTEQTAAHRARRRTENRPSNEGGGSGGYGGRGPAVERARGRSRLLWQGPARPRDAAFRSNPTTWWTPWKGPTRRRRPLAQTRGSGGHELCKWNRRWWTPWSNR